MAAHRVCFSFHCSILNWSNLQASFHTFSRHVTSVAGHTFQLLRAQTHKHTDQSLF